ncbi:MAG: protein kinase [Candidatus Obscuribacterales bacterium]
MTVTVCADCGKLLSTHDGSLTQWMFGASRCSCENPRPVSNKIDTFIEPIPDTDDQEEIEVEAGRLPTDRYKVLAELGSGASSVVYLCRDRLLFKTVAVKSLLRLTGEQLVSFQKEAIATSRLSHPNIISILDFGVTSAGSPYMVLEYFSGMSLERYLEQFGALDLLTMRSVFMKLACALGYAHSQGIFHRDLKPSNILIRDSDEGLDVKLIDFGVATVKESSGFVTEYQSRTLAGTPAYMSPDTALGGVYDSQSEIYSLGCVLYESLAGRPPFGGETALETLSQHVHAKLPDINDFLENKLSPAYSSMIHKCLAKEKFSRYATMKELQAALEALEPDEGNGAAFDPRERRSAGISGGKSKGRSLALFGVVAVLLILAAIAFDRRVVILAMAGDARAQMETGLSYIKKDPEKARYWLGRAAAEGLVAAQMELAELLQEEGKSSDAFAWYRQAAERGVPEAQLELAMCYEDGIGVAEDQKAAADWCRKAADQGYGEAQLVLAEYYFYGIGVLKDLPTAVELCRKSALQGYPVAEHWMGYFYNTGQGVELNPTKATAYFRLAAEKGLASSQAVLGYAYLQGRGVEKDPETGCRWLRKAADQGDAMGFDVLGNCYRDGIGVKKDLKKAFECFKSAAERSEVFSMEKLATCYRDGTGVRQDLELAFAWYKKAAENDSGSAQYNLGECYENGAGTEKDLNEAFKWYLRAAEKNVAWAQNRLGEFYEQGKGVRKDRNRAIFWYRKSAAQGFKWGQKNLERCL